MIRYIATVSLAGFIFCLCAWGLYEFVNLKFGPPPACEVSNTCH